MEWERVHLPPPVTMRELKKLAKGDKQSAKRSMEYFNRCEHWINETHHVAIDRNSGTIGDGTVVIHLSIKRHDREPISDWRVMQDIKTSLLGPDHEAMELYPAESRVVDLANQYHLWCIVDADGTPMAAPFGFAGGWQDDTNVGADIAPALAKAKQRPLTERGS